MFNAILFKEWLKTRSVYIISLIAAAAMTTYTILMMSRLISLKGVEHLWMIMLLKDNSFVDMLKYVPTAIGIAIAVAQMMPEMTHKRLKLTLHLPCSQTKLILTMLAIGVAELISIYLMMLAAISIYDARILPSELVTRVLLTMLPWCFAGLSAYLFTCSICLEATWRRRVIIGLLGIATLLIYFLQPALEAYNGILAALIIFIILSIILPLGSIIRFKEGRQD